MEIQGTVRKYELELLVCKVKLGVHVNIFKINIVNVV